MLVRGTLAAAHLACARHEVLAAPDLMRRFPAFRLPPDHVAVVQPDGGFLAAEPRSMRCLRSRRAAAAELSAPVKRCAQSSARRRRAVGDRPGGVDAGQRHRRSGP